MQPVTESNRAQAITVLAEAFRDDPVLNWMFSGVESMEPFFELTLPVFLPHGLTYLNDSENGAATWLGPNQKLSWPMGPGMFWQVFRYSGLSGMLKMAVSGVKTERYHPPVPHYYLFAIGVSPELKGQGQGTALIKHVLMDCDREGVPAYLENSRAENIPFYEGHGFRIQREIRFTRNAPPMWLMWREPG